MQKLREKIVQKFRENMQKFRKKKEIMQKKYRI